MVVRRHQTADSVAEPTSAAGTLAVVEVVATLAVAETSDHLIELAHALRR